MEQMTSAKSALLISSESKFDSLGIQSTIPVIIVTGNSMPPEPSEKITSVHCSDCGKRDDLNWMEDIRQLLIHRNLCFYCNFWYDYTKKVNHPRSVRISNSHYWIEKEDVPSGAFRGFNGRKFRIVFQNGREVITTNLWSQGTIPPRFRGRLPDNAEFGKL